MLTDDLRNLDPRDTSYASRFVERLLAAVETARASDAHLQPTPNGLAVSWRLDGVLQPVGEFPAGKTTDVVARLKVLAELLTYRVDLPQEGRIRRPGQGADWRVSTFPTLHGERAVVRLVASAAGPRRLSELGLPAETDRALRGLLAETAGALLITGPAGSGKTTTAYACLRDIVGGRDAARCAITLEDPIEAPLDGVVQSQLQPAAGFDLATGLRSVLRQDPEVILIGEIRDRMGAEGVFNAALTGHLVIATFHAASAAGAISRLAEMDIEPYLLRSGLLAVLNQRLLRRLCDCAAPASPESDTSATRTPAAIESQLIMPDTRAARSVTGESNLVCARRPIGCGVCQRTGYRGRLLLAELLLTSPTELGRAILSRDDAARLEQLAQAAGLVPIAAQAAAAVRSGLTSEAEVLRTLGSSRYYPPSTASTPTANRHTNNNTTNTTNNSNSSNSTANSAANTDNSTGSVGEPGIGAAGIGVALGDTDISPPLGDAG
ncbi:MAG: GspE/PulE family protein [Planctomycetota bacterium]